MSEINIQFPVDLKQNNVESSEFYGRWYATTPPRKTLSTRGFAQHIAEHGSVCTLEVIMLVLNQMATCIPELLSQNVSVELEGIGTFYPTVDSKKSSKATVQAALDAGVDNMVKGVHMRFLPWSEDLFGLTAKQMKAKCSLRWNDVVTVETREDPTTHKKKRFQTRIPVEQYATSQIPAPEEP